MSEVKELALNNLCYHDKRNPEHTRYHDEPSIDKSKCYCDNCFYRRHELAEVILKLLDKGG